MQLAAASTAVVAFCAVYVTVHLAWDDLRQWRRDRRYRREERQRQEKRR